MGEIINFTLVKFILVTQILFLVQLDIKRGADANDVDTSYCKKYTPVPYDLPDQKDDLGRPFLYMGETYSKKFYLANLNTTASYFEAAYYVCMRFGFQLATIKTACDYGIVEKWFMDHYPTTYSAWIAGFRFGDSTQRPPLWITTGELLDFTQINLNVNYIQGPYPPGGYSPIVYPWVNCLSVSRNCPIFTSGPTNPCTQTSTYPSLQFMWEDCRISSLRVICEETSYSKEGSNELEQT